MPIHFFPSQNTTQKLNHESISQFNLAFVGVVTAQDFDEWLNAMSQLLNKHQLFAVVYQTDPHVSLPTDYRVKEANWYKTNKLAFFTYCKALVRVANDEQERDRLNTPAMHKAWQVPYFVALSKEEAIDWLNGQSLVIN